MKEEMGENEMDNRIKWNANDKMENDLRTLKWTKPIC
jgi:hypothetical protein